MKYKHQQFDERDNEKGQSFDNDESNGDSNRCFFPLYCSSSSSLKRDKALFRSR